MIYRFRFEVFEFLIKGESFGFFVFLDFRVYIFNIIVYMKVF